MILLPSLGYSLCLLNLGINPNKILIFGKNLQNWESTGLFLDWAVLGCKIGKIKSLLNKADYNNFSESKEFKLFIFYRHTASY